MFTHEIYRIVDFATIVFDAAVICNRVAATVATIKTTSYTKRMRIAVDVLCSMRTIFDE